MGASSIVALVPGACFGGGEYPARNSASRVDMHLQTKILNQNVQNASSTQTASGF